MSFDRAIEWTTAVALVLSGIHLASPHVREWARDRTAWLGPASAGALAAYIFLHLLPSLGEGEQSFGMEVTAAALGGFVVYYVAETVLDDHPGRMFRVKIGSGWLYSFLIVYSLPSTLEESPLAAMVSSVALGVHVLQSDNRLAWQEPRPFDRVGRWVLASAPLTAVVVDALRGDPDPQTAATLSAVASGVLLLGLFRDEIGQRTELRNLPWFLLGLAVYGGLLALEGAVR